MSDPFEIIVNGKKLVGWQECTLTRRRESLTWEATFTVFYDKMPTNPVMRDILPGAELQFYVGGNLAANGSVDSRSGASVKRGGRKGSHRVGGVGAHGLGSHYVGGDVGDDFMRSVDISKDGYRVTFQCRGKAKAAADASHTHETGSMKKTTAKQAIEALVKPLKIEVEDKANLQDAIDRVFADGAMIRDEIHSILRFSGASIFETRQGKLKIANDADEGSGVDLILGQNILNFSAEQTEEFQRSTIKIKGARLGPNQYGRDAVTKSTETLEVKSVKTLRSFVGQIAGDATQDRLRKAAKNEAATREMRSKTIAIDVFHVQQPSGEPWDLNVSHYVEIPPENIFDEFVTTEVTYQVSADEIKTRLTLAPKAAVAEGVETGGGTMSDSEARGVARRQQIGVPNEAGSYPSPWGEFSVGFLEDGAAVSNGDAGSSVIEYPPDKLPQ